MVTDTAGADGRQRWPDEQLQEVSGRVGQRLGEGFLGQGKQNVSGRPPMESRKPHLSMDQAKVTDDRTWLVVLPHRSQALFHLNEI